MNATILAVIIAIVKELNAFAQTGSLSDVLNQIRHTVNEVDFYLFTRNVTDEFTQVETIQNSDIKIDVQIKFIVHGWGENRAKPYYKQMTDAYLQRGDYNILHVDWSKPARASYASAVRNTLLVGKAIGKFVIKLSEKNGVALAQIHIIGHSLGGHVAGIAGKEVFKATGSKIGRITGLDPAGPLYEEVPNNVIRRLNKTDADMVDVVHTDGGVFGYRGPIGTVDFFPNGGVGFQPGCSLLQESIAQFNRSLEYVFCSHVKSHQYFISSINTKIEARRCNSWAEYVLNGCKFDETVIFGEDAPPSATGKYYFRIK